MTHLYLPNPNVRVNFEYSLVIVGKRVLRLKKNEKRFLANHYGKVLVNAQVKQMPKSFLDKYFVKIRIHIPNKGGATFLKANYLKCDEANASSFVVHFRKKMTLMMPHAKLRLTIGRYILPLGFDKLIPNDIHRKYYKQLDITPIRDEWILHQLRLFNPKDILELGAGVEGRLKDKVLKACPDINYFGIDLRLEIPTDITKTLPSQPHGHLVIAEEVIEHLEEQEIMPLIQRIKHSGAAGFIITTPNRDYNKYIERKLRHPDHKFEWGKYQLDRWKIRILKKFKCRIKVVAIGKKISGVSPSWGISITFL